MSRPEQVASLAALVTTSGAASLSAKRWSWTPAGRSHPVLAELDLEINPGERVLLLGASGSGKSTLLKAWAGVLGGDDEGVQRGALQVDGRAPSAARGRTGLLLQDPDAQLVLARSGDDVAFGPENLGVPVSEIARRVPDAFAAVGLQFLAAEHDTTRLSGGQKQRLALAGVLAMRPGVLLLDEPTAQLDPVGVREVAGSVAALVADRQITLVVVEHRVDVWAPLVDRVIVLENGCVIADGPIDEVMATRGADLAHGGVWVPGREPRHPAPGLAALGPTVLTARGLAVAQPDGGVIARGIDLDVCGGEVVALTGPNGAGKSTLLLTLAGLLPAAAGSVNLDAGGAPAGDPAEWHSRDLVTRLGVVFQNPEHQFVAVTVRDELAVGPRAAGRDPAEVARVVESLLDVRRDPLHLSALSAANPFTLSGGEQRRLSVATALATAPPILLLDEPSFGQDSRTWAELVALIAVHRDGGGAVVMATHDRALITALSAREFALPAYTPSFASAATLPSAYPVHPAPRAPRTPSALPAPRRQALAERINPVAALAAALIPALLLVVTIDPVSAGVALALQLLLMPFLGVPIRTLALRSIPILIAAPFTALTIVLYGRPSGEIYVEFLLVRISDGSMELALATLLRVLAIALPAVALFSHPDATRLGDALGQTARLPARFVLGAVAAMRLVSVLRADARMLERARRARGIGDRGRVRKLAGIVLGLLVLSLRRGSALAIGMEARGFGAPGPRTWVRPSPWRAIDTAILLVAIAVSITAVMAAVLTGQFTSVFP